MAFNMSYDIISEANKLMRGVDPSFTVPSGFFDEGPISSNDAVTDLGKLKNEVQTPVLVETELIAAR